jgi:phosphoglucomutase
MSLAAAREYLASPHLEPELRADLEPLLKAAEAGDAQALTELNDRFSEPLAFGTGGLRGVMAAGLRRMNRPTIRRVTLAVAAVTQQRAPQCKTALVGFDTRLQSDVFAKETARILAQAGYQVYLGTKPLPTPFLCYAMRKLGTGCGIIVTASHNPKEYNGYKAYDNTGAQVISPWDTEIEAAMASLPVVPPVPSAEVDSRIVPIPQEVEEAYFAMGLEFLQRPKEFSPAKLLYTPFHGTGIAHVPEFFKRAGIPLEVCAAQATPDGTFPTAPRPNPEEIAAYKTPLAEADQIGADAILSNDPDADRIGVITKRKGQWELMTGNDLCALTLDYLCSQKGLKGVVVTTVVTSDFVAEVARLHGRPVAFTLTGFKWIAACMQRLTDVGESYGFGAEESFGMQLSDQIRDKDGVTAALVVGEMIGHYKAKGMTLFDGVDVLKQKAGDYQNRLLNLEDPKPGGALRFAQAMTRIRQANPKTFAGEALTCWEDFEAGQLHRPDGSTEAIVDRPDRMDIAQPLPLSNVIKFRLASGAYAAFRPSGTEPKLKVYLQSRTGVETLDKMEAEARKMLGLG